MSKNIKNPKKHKLKKHKELRKQSITKTYSVGLLDCQTKNEFKR